MATTVRDIINGSLRLLGVLAQGETPSAAESSDALSAMNMMLDSFSNEHLFLYKRTIEEFTLVSSQSTYTMGTGGDFSTSNPIKVEAAYIKINTSSPAFEVPMDILNADQWADITQKSVTSAIPTRLYVQNGQPTSTLYMWPVPTVAYNIVLHSLKPIGSFSSINDSVVLPEGYERLIRYNLAIELAPEYNKEPSGTVIKIANDAKANIKRSNSSPVYMETDFQAGKKPFFDYRTGE